jgi:class 3 adenylate cyclase
VVGFGIHLFVYAVGIALVTVVWALTGDHSAKELTELVADVPGDPGLVNEESFWPAWVWLGWSAALVIHFGVVLSLGLFGRRTRRHAHALAKQAAQAAAQLTSRSAQTRPRAPSGPTRQWVAVMFTDVVGSTPIAEQLGDEEWSRVLGRHREFVRTCLGARGGTEVGTQGDGSLGRFATPADAVSCAVDIQRQLGEVRAASDGFPLEVRIGIHAGEAVEEEGDLIGQVVNLASRVTGIAEPNEILVTEPVADHLNGEFSIEDRGLHKLRGVSRPRHLLAVNWAE